MTLNKLVVGLTLALSLVACNEKQSNNSLSLCDLAYPQIAEQCDLVIKKKEGRKVYCECSDKTLDDTYGCRYVHTKGHDVYFCGGE
jgi:hypothetical protein